MVGTGATGGLKKQARKENIHRRHLRAQGSHESEAQGFDKENTSMTADVEKRRTNSTPHGSPGPGTPKSVPQVTATRQTANSSTAPQVDYLEVT